MSYLHAIIVAFALFSDRVAVQLLLHMLSLTLPGLPETSSPKKRKRSTRKEEPKHEIMSKEIIEARVQIYMDKLSTWQLVRSLENLQVPSSTAHEDEEHDWVQKFFIEVVEP